MPHEELTYEDLLRIVELIKSSERFSEFRLKVGEIEVELRRSGAPAAASLLPAPAPARPPPVGREVESALPVLETKVGSYAKPTWPEGSHVICSPMVGTFYRSPDPSAPAFVAVGQAVDPETIVCIIEVMKLMNSIPAGAHGTVLEVLVDDAAPVQAGQPLIVVQLR